jgi:hypothetical protein
MESREENNGRSLKERVVKIDDEQKRTVWQ